MSTFIEDNITVLNPWVEKNFWDKLPNDVEPDEGYRLYEEFLKRNSTAINETNTALLSGDYEVINEKYGVDASEFENTYSTAINEAFAKPKGRAVQVEDEFSDDKTAPKPEEPASFIQKKEKKKEEEEAEEDPSGTMLVYNYGLEKKKKDEAKEEGRPYTGPTGSSKIEMEHDIHKVVNQIYLKLEATNKNHNKFTQLSVLSTIKVKEMDALFAFMDIPNMDLSQRGATVWHTRNVYNMEGIFYESSFHNDSIGTWDVANVINSPTGTQGFVNAFIGTDWTEDDGEKWLAGWNYNSKVKPPVFGASSQTEEDEQRFQSTIDRETGSLDEIEAELKRYDTEKKNSLAKKMGTTNENKTVKMTGKYVMSSSEFINEGRIGNAFRKIGSKIKSAVETVGIALKNGFVMVVDKFGEMLNVVVPQSSVNYANQNVAGVSAALNGKPNYAKEDGVYDSIEKNSEEYNNYIYLLKTLETKGGVNEARIPLSDYMETEQDIKNGQTQVVRNSGFSDISTEKFTKLLSRALKHVNDGTKQKPLLIWGAPGIGKTSIPKAIISEMNEGVNDAKGKRGLIVADCSMMTSDGFSLPTLAKNVNIKDSEWGKILMDAYGITDDEINDYNLTFSDDAPKTWLPMYKPTGNPEKDAVLNDLANGSVGRIYNEKGKVVGYEVTGNGGIIMFDELLRSKRDILNVVCQIVDTREYKGFVLGDKWTMIACSNRPYDDDEIRKVYMEKGQMFFRRFSGYNLVPSFKDWCEWAKKHGFDDTTLEWIAAADVDGPKSRWHYMDPEMHKTENKPKMASPAGWAAVMDNLHVLASDEGVKNLKDIDKDDFRLTVEAELPDDIAKAYTDYYYKYAGKNNENLYDLVIKDPSKKIYELVGNGSKNNLKAIDAIDKILNTIRIRYDATKSGRIPPKEFFACLYALGSSYPEVINEIYNNFYVKVYNLCNLYEVTEDYDEDNTDNPYYDVDTYFAKYHPDFRA